MNTTTINTTVDAGNLTQPLASAAVYHMDYSKTAKLASGNRWCKLIKKGSNSKLPQSVAVEVPSLTAAQLANYMQQGIIAEAVLEYVQALQDAQIKAAIIAGAAQIQYADLTASKLAEFLATSDDTGRIGQLSSERIVGWFDADARELLIVALADRLGIADTASEQDVKRLEQIANQTRDNLAKLASKKPVVFDDRVKGALNWALDVTAAGDVMTERLREKLNTTVKQDDLLANLGF